MRERLVEIRKYFQLSQRDFCKKLGMTQSTYAPLETGKREIREAYVKLICQAYNINEMWFKTGEGEMLVDKTDLGLEDLLSVYDNLSPALRKYLLQQARELMELQKEIKTTDI